MALSGIIAAINEWIGRAIDFFMEHVPRPIKILLFTAVAGFLVSGAIGLVANWTYDCEEGTVYKTGSWASDDSIMCRAALDFQVTVSGSNTVIKFIHNETNDTQNWWGIALSPTWSLLSTVTSGFQSMFSGTGNIRAIKDFRTNKTWYVSDFENMSRQDALETFCTPFSHSSRDFLYPVCEEDNSATFTLRGAKIFDPLNFVAMIVFIELAAFAIYFLKD